MAPQREHGAFAAEARSVGQARAWVAQRLAGLPDGSMDDVLLLTSELVTNAVLHGAGPVGVHVALSNGVVRVEVEDQSPQRPVLGTADSDALSGRGLILVEGLSSDWGVLVRGTGKTVWFTLNA